MSRLAWTKTADTMPDSDMTVLMWVRYGDGAEDWVAGWRDEEEWRDAATGGVVDGDVTHWCDPQGPAK